MRGPSIYNDGEATSYELLEEHRRGGEGRTWRARQISPGGRVLPVAVKVLTPDSYLGSAVDPETVLRTWRDQMQVMRSFGHEGFASVQVAFSIAPTPLPDSSTPPWMLGLPAFVMAWVDGEALSTWSPKVADPRVRLEVLQLCARGLDAFHRQTEHVHRDLKPSNIVVTGGHGRIIDFGLVRSVEQLRSRSGAAGSPGYLAPELYDGAEYSPATDLFAFAGVVFHQLLLQNPNPGWRPGHIRELLRDAGFDSAADLLSDALHPDPSMRPSDMTATTLLEQALRPGAVKPVSISLDEAETLLQAGPARARPAPQAAPSERSTVVTPVARERAAGTEVASSRATLVRIISLIVVSTALTVLLVVLLQTLAN